MNVPMRYSGLVVLRSVGQRLVVYRKDSLTWHGGRSPVEAAEGSGRRSAIRLRTKSDETGLAHLESCVYEEGQLPCLEELLRVRC